MLVAEPLTTPRLQLEPLRTEHASELTPVLDDPALHAFTGGTPSTESELRERFARQVAGRWPDGAQDWLNWVVRDRVTHEAVGTLQVTVNGRTAELAWVIATSRQGEGLATEAATAVADALRADGVTTLVAHIHPDHAASAAIARRLGLQPTQPRDDGEIRWVS